METNKNRIVSIYRSVSNTGTGSEDWRHNLSRLLNGDNRSSEQGQMFSSEQLSNLDVDGRVDLLMANKPPQFAISNDYSIPVKTFVDKVSGGAVGDIANVISAGVKTWDKVMGILKEEESNEDPATSTDTWLPWVRNVKAWGGNVSGVAFDYTFDFAMGQYGLWNAKAEVFLPIVNLMAPTLPQHLNAAMMAGPIPTAINLISNIITNTTSDFKSEKSAMSDYFGWDSKKGLMENLGSNLEGSGKLLESLVMNAYRGYVYEVKFGNVVHFHKVLFKNSKVEFSNEVDQYGFPISGSVTLSFEGMIPMSLTSSTTDNMAARFGGGSL